MSDRQAPSIATICAGRTPSGGACMNLVSQPGDVCDSCAERMRELQTERSAAQMHEIPAALAVAYRELYEAVVEYRNELDDKGVADDERMGWAVARIDQVRNG